jgi:hypothetical protein
MMRRLLFLAMLLWASPARATNWIYDGTTSYGAISGTVFPKTDLTPVPAGQALYYVGATDWNRFGQAITDIRTWARGANYMGWTEQSGAPAGFGGSSQPAVIYAKTDHTLHFKANGSDIALGSGSGGTLQNAYDAGGGTIGLTIDDGSFDIDLAGSGQSFRIEDASVGTVLAAIDLSQIGFTSAVSDGASAVALSVDTSTAWSNGTAKLLTLANNGTEKFSVGQQGDVIAAGTITSGGTAVVLTSRTLTGGTGISSIGNLSADRTISIDQSFAPTWTGTHRWGSGSQRFTLTNSQMTVYNSTGGGQQVADLGSAFAALRLGNGFNIKWFNDTDISGSAEDVILARTGTSEFGVYLTTSPDVRFKVSDSSTDHDVGVYVSRRQTTWSLQHVTEAAADSCGSGFRCLRIPN